MCVQCRFSIACNVYGTYIFHFTIEFEYPWNYTGGTSDTWILYFILLTQKLCTLPAKKNYFQTWFSRTRVWNGNFNTGLQERQVAHDTELYCFGRQTRQYITWYFYTCSYHGYENPDIHFFPPCHLMKCKSTPLSCHVCGGGAWEVKHYWTGRCGGSHEK